MSTVLYVGMDVHSTSYSLATFALGDREARFELKIEPDYEQVLQYLVYRPRISYTFTVLKFELLHPHWDPHPPNAISSDTLLDQH